MNFSENTNLLPGGQSASPSKVKELENRIDDLAQTVTNVADSVAGLSNEVTTAELNATSANVTNAVIDNATVGTETATTVNATTANADTLNATDANLTNITSDNIETNSFDANNGYFGIANALLFTGQSVDVSEDVTALNKVQGKTVQATEKVVTPALESTTTELKGATTVRGDVHFPENGDKIYGEYLEVEANKVKVKNLTTETPADTNQLVGYDNNGNLIPVDASLDPVSLWEPGSSDTIRPKNDKKILVRGATVEEDLRVEDDLIVEDDLLVSGDATVSGELTVSGSATLLDTSLYSADISENLNVHEDAYVSGNTTLKNTEVNGTLTVKGDIIQNGSAYETHAEKLYTKKDIIITRDGAVSGLSTGEYTGIQATKYDGTNDGQLVFDKDGEARVGDVGDTQPLLTRDEVADLTDGSLLKWDATNKKAVSAQSADIIPSDASTSNKLATEASVSNALNNKTYTEVYTSTGIASTLVKNTNLTDPRQSGVEQIYGSTMATNADAQVVYKEVLKTLFNAKNSKPFNFGSTNIDSDYSGSVVFHLTGIVGFPNTGSFSDDEDNPTSGALVSQSIKISFSDTGVYLRIVETKQGRTDNIYVNASYNSVNDSISLTADNTTYYPCIGLLVEN